MKSQKYSTKVNLSVHEFIMITASISLICQNLWRKVKETVKENGLKTWTITSYIIDLRTVSKDV